LDVARSTLNYKADQHDDDALRLAMMRLAKAYGHYGYRKITQLLQIEGWKVNHIWSIDFVHDKLTNGRGCKTLTGIDEYTRDAGHPLCSPAFLTDSGIPATLLQPHLYPQLYSPGPVCGVISRQQGRGKPTNQPRDILW
jgi:hypothetical protein